jgi:hypothetical protein
MAGQHPERIFQGRMTAITTRFRMLVSTSPRSLAKMVVMLVPKFGELRGSSSAA